jgi:hypothetical protein
LDQVGGVGVGWGLDLVDLVWLLKEKSYVGALFDT